MQADIPRELLLYFGLAYLISWIIWLPLILGQSGLGWLHIPLPEVITLFSGAIQMSLWLTAGTFGPTVAALATQGICRSRPFGFRFWSALAPMLKGLVIGALCLLIMRWFLPAVIEAGSGFHSWNWQALGYVRYYFLPSLIGGPLGEEPGWRGFALDRMQKLFGPTKASLLLGLVWSGWHLPLFLVHGWTSAPLWAFIVIDSSLSVVMSVAHNLSRGSVLVAVLMHTLFNAAGAPLHLFLAGASLRGHFDEVAACSFLIGAAAIIALTRGRLGFNPLNQQQSQIAASFQPQPIDE